MSDISYRLAIDVAKVYRVRAVGWHAWGNATVRSWSKGGSLDIQSDYGSYSHIWVDTGGHFLKFLTEVEYDYFMRKTRHDDYRIFDSEATRDAIVEQIIGARRDGSIEGDWARLLFDEARRYETNDLMTRDALGRQLSHHMWRFLGDDFPARTRDNEETRGFWENVWPMFTDAWRRELDPRLITAGSEAA